MFERACQPDHHQTLCTSRSEAPKRYSVLRLAAARARVGARRTAGSYRGLPSSHSSYLNAERCAAAAAGFRFRICGDGKAGFHHLILKVDC